MSSAVQECTRCVMNSEAAGAVFDSQGRCNYCTEMLEGLAQAHVRIPDPASLKRRLSSFTNTVKEAGKRKRYDCIVGISGGADSAYALYVARNQGLRPLAVHLDNGWNSELAVNNIENLVRKLDVDLYTHVVDWREYRALQQAFFDAGVIDIELLFDNAMLALNYQMARRYGIRFILSGSNTATEGMRMPKNYNWNKFDQQNIRAIARRNGVKVRSLPTIGVMGYAWNRLVRGIQWVPFLDYVEYDKQRCLEELAKEIGYRPYPYKHYESIFTRFYQGHILPTKFGIDKRRLHLSSLICSGQMTRSQAAEILTRSPYPDPDILQDDIEYFLKKLDWTPHDLETYFGRPQHEHDEYPSEAWLYALLGRLRGRFLSGAR